MNNKSIIFFIRAYNDLDIQLSLISELAADKQFKVRVVFYFSDGFITHVNAHESISETQSELDVKFSSILEFEQCPFILKSLYKIKKWAYLHRSKPLAKNFIPIGLFYKILDAGIGQIIQPCLNKENPEWLNRVSLELNPDIIFCDEILFQEGRSSVIDNLIPALVKKGAVCYSILTGHRVYKALNPTNEKDPAPVETKSIASRYFVPSQHNKDIYEQLFPKADITIAGNLRMDRKWVEKLGLAASKQPNTFPDAPLKIVLMLSKIGYGIKRDELVNTIKSLGQMNNVAFIIKPHTRAMKFDFMSKDEIGNAIIADDIPSSELIEWSDLVLMTGSSIVFHAIQRDKLTGFLKYCQELETIFNDGLSASVFNSLRELETYCENAIGTGLPPPPLKDNLDLKKFVQDEIHGGIENGNVAKNYKRIILNDIKKI